jgi:hypothetical protein|tara:strand:- start:35 stop:250 length:216 start_codon:yes stop_codon:yes gene_type:complete
MEGEALKDHLDKNQPTKDQNQRRGMTEAVSTPFYQLTNRHSDEATPNSYPILDNQQQQNRKNKDAQNADYS